MQVQKTEPLLKSFEKVEKTSLPVKFILGGFLIVLVGVATGYFLFEKGAFAPEKVLRNIKKEEVKKGVTVGIVDERTFKDSAQGILKEGGIEGEGSHHLERPGGTTQNVYLTSSVVDLDKFVDRKVEVWGETFAAQKAGWLMDVGKLKVLE